MRNAEDQVSTPQVPYFDEAVDAQHICEELRQLLPGRTSLPCHATCRHKPRARPPKVHGSIRLKKPYVARLYDRSYGIWVADGVDQFYALALFLYKSVGCDLLRWGSTARARPEALWEPFIWVEAKQGLEGYSGYWSFSAQGAVDILKHHAARPQHRNAY